MNVEIYNNIGQLIEQKQNISNQKEVQISGLSNGVYFVNILADGIKISTQRVVVLK